PNGRASAPDSPDTTSPADKPAESPDAARPGPARKFRPRTLPEAIRAYLYCLRCPPPPPEAARSGENEKPEQANEGSRGAKSPPAAGEPSGAKESAKGKSDGKEDQAESKDKEKGSAAEEQPKEGKE